MAQTFYITTPIYYANSLPHLGHLYSTIIADVVQRYKKQRGFETFFLTGTDEHGLNIQRAADKAGRTPKEQVDYISGELKRMFADFRLDPEHGGYDIFMRTTEPFHYEAVRHFWNEIAAKKTPKGNDAIYKGFYEGWFCAPCAEFKTEEQYYLPDGEKMPHCPIHERPLDAVAEESYFFRLSDYEEFLIGVIESDPGLVRPPARRNEVLSFIRSGLQDLSISRLKSSVSWGIAVPGDEDHVMYVWLDALSNYITAIGYGNDEKESAGFEKFWSNVVHIVGKDILRFHTVYWFSFLHAAGLPLPTSVYAHGMWLDADGRKMGKTMGNVVEVDVLHEHFQVDAIRYFVLREMVFGQDGKFGYTTLIDRINGDLAGGLGNLASRTLAMVAKYREGIVPDGKIAEENYIHARRAGIDPDGQDLVSVLERARDEFIRKFDSFEFSHALETLWNVIARVDKLISDAKPWELIKDERQPASLDAVLYRACETLRWLAVLLAPVMPQSSQRIYEQLGIAGDAASVDPASLGWGDLGVGTLIGKSEAVFPRVDKVKVMNEISKGSGQLSVDRGQHAVPELPASEQGPADTDQFISIDDFLKVELRVGEIKVAEPVPNADKLLRFEVDLGEDRPRQILAGLAEHYAPENLIGRKVVVVANLKPRKMRGLESQGMICAASLAEEDAPAIATFLENVKVGARLR